MKPQYRDNKIDEVPTTHLAAGTGDVVVVFRVITVPRTPERVVEEWVRILTRTCGNLPR